MSDLGRVAVFIGIMFVTLFTISYVSSFYDSVLEPYEPIQSVRPTTTEDKVEIYDADGWSYDKRINKPYLLITKSDESSEFYYKKPRFVTFDYGTFKEIDSLKCVRYKQMQWKMYKLDKLNEKSCE